MPRIPAFNDADDFVDLKLLEHFLQKGDPLFQTSHNDGIDLRMIVKQFERVDDDRLAIEFEKLLRARLSIHPYARSSGKNDGNVHTFKMLFACKVSRFPSNTVADKQKKGIG